MASCSFAADLHPQLQQNWYSPGIESSNDDSERRNFSTNSLQPQFVSLSQLANMSMRKSLRVSKKSGNDPPSSEKKAVDKDSKKPQIGKKRSESGAPSKTAMESTSKAETSRQTSKDVNTSPAKPVVPGTRKRKRKSLKNDSGNGSKDQKVESPEKQAEREEVPDSVLEPKRKRRQKDATQEASSTPPVVKPKVCSNCGTIAQKRKAKKCQKCKKFFYSHWARRCRIPPCPKCHYSRKARGCVVLPDTCERCGHNLPNLEDGDSISECSSVVSAEMDPVHDNMDASSCHGEQANEQVSGVVREKSVSSEGNQKEESSEAPFSQGSAVDSTVVMVSKESTPAKENTPEAVVSKKSTPTASEESSPMVTISKESTPMASKESTPTVTVSKESTPAVTISKESTPPVVTVPTPVVSKENAPVATESTPVSKESTPVSKESTPVVESVPEEVHESTCSVQQGTEENLMPFVELDSENSTHDSVCDSGNISAKGLGNEDISLSMNTECGEPQTTKTTESETTPDSKPPLKAGPTGTKVECTSVDTSTIGADSEKLSTSSSHLKRSDDLPQISAMLDNIENASTIIASSSAKLKKSLEDPPGELAEKSMGGGKGVDKLVYFAKEFQKLYSQTAGESENEQSSSVLSSDIDKKDGRKDSNIKESLSSGEPLEDDGGTERSKQSSQDSKEGSALPTESKFIPIAPKRPHLAGGIPSGLESLISMPISQILNQVHLSSQQLGLPTIQPLVLPSNTPISLTMPQSAQQGGLSSPSLSSSSLNLNCSLASSLMELMAKSVPLLPITLTPATTTTITTTAKISAAPSSQVPITSSTQVPATSSTRLPITQIPAAPSEVVSSAQDSAIVPFAQVPITSSTQVPANSSTASISTPQAPATASKVPFLTTQVSANSSTASKVPFSAQVPTEVPFSTLVAAASKVELPFTAQIPAKPSTASKLPYVPSTAASKLPYVPSTAASKLPSADSSTVPSTHTSAASTQAQITSSSAPITQTPASSQPISAAAVAASSSFASKSSPPPPSLPPPLLQPGELQNTAVRDVVFTSEPAKTSCSAKKVYSGGECSNTRASNSDVSLPGISSLPAVSSLLSMRHPLLIHDSKPVSSPSCYNSMITGAPPPLKSQLETTEHTSSDVMKMFPSTVMSLPCPPPPLKSIPERTLDNSIIKIHSAISKDPSQPCVPKMEKESNSTVTENLFFSGQRDGSRIEGVSVTADNELCNVNPSLKEVPASTAPPLHLPITSTKSHPASVIVGSAGIKSHPASTTNVTAGNAGVKVSAITFTKEMPLGSSPALTHSTMIFTSSDVIDSQVKPVDVAGITCGSSITSPTTGGGISAFHKLDFSLSSSSPHTGNKIRVSLLKQNLENLQESSSFPSPGVTVLPERIPVPPPLSSIAMTFGTDGVSTSRPQTLTSSASDVIVTTLSTDSSTANVKLQNYAVSPKLATVGTQGSDDQLDENTKPLLSIKTQSDSFESTDLVVSENTGSVTEESGEAISGFDLESTSISSSASNVCTVSALSSNSSIPTSNLDTVASNAPASSSVTSIGSDSDSKMDATTIEKLTSKVQMRIKNALSSDNNNSSGSNSPEETEAKSALVPPTTRPMPGYRRILPNLSKNSTTVSTNASPSFSHVRTPGVVMVQVCSNIPANLTLSSITNSSSPTSGSDVDPRKTSIPGIIKPRGVVPSGGNVMITPLSPSMLPPGRTVAHIVTTKTPLSKEDGDVSKDKISSRTRSRGSSADGELKLMSEESLNSSLDSSEQASEAGSTKGKKRTSAGGSDKGQVHEDEDTVKDGEDSEEEGEESKEGGGAGDGDSSRERKRKKGPTSSGKKKKTNDMLLYTVKLKDCFMHHLMWNEHRVVLIVPITPKADISTRSRSMGEGSSSRVVPSDSTPISERRRRRKPKIETLQDADEEYDEYIENSSSSPCISSAHIRIPCFSMYELRLKHFSHMANNAVYAYTYKHQIKSLKTPTHWVQVLRRMGGVQEHGHTCRLVDIKHVKEMCQHFSVTASIPSNLDSLCRNDFPKSRILIDLSQFSPEQLLEPDRLDVIPACPFVETSNTSIDDELKKRKTSQYSVKKRLYKEGQLQRRKTHDKTKSRKRSLSGKSCDQTSENKNEEHNGEESQEVLPTEQSCSDALVKSHDQSRDHSSSMVSMEQCTDEKKVLSEETVLSQQWSDEEDGEDEYESDDEEVQLPPSKRPPPPLIKHSSMMSSSEKLRNRVKVEKKHCPECGNPIARKCKKCPSCGKRFGVFTFGRKLCPSCGRINLARMANCFKCSHPMINAPKAIPTLTDEKFLNRKNPATRSGSMFGAKKRRLQPLVNTGSSSSSSRFLYGALATSSYPKYKMKQNHLQMTAKSPLDPLPILPPLSAPSSRHSSVTEVRSALEGDNPLHIDYFTSTSQGQDGSIQLPGDRREEVYEEGKQPPMRSKQSGYQYGRIPWSDADITCLVDEKGVAKFCLQELCSKVLHNHAKGDVFDMVKNLNLPLEHGDIALLKKLQALGLHSNRSPMCRLIASEELWTLLDALQEPVPEEVYQHLEHISTSSTPLLSPRGVVGVIAAVEAAASATTTAVAAAGGGGEEEEDGRTGTGGEGGGETGTGTGTGITTGTAGTMNVPSGLRSPGLVPSGTATMVEEDERGFESTLHEVDCSDGQSVSILRAFNGEQFACVTEFWRKYFPEVNRNHLTSALKRLSLDTLMPTGQQATLLRAAGVISLRGAAGRLMRLENMEKLLDDFGIPLQIGKPTDKIRLSSGSGSGGSSGARVLPPPKLSVKRPSMRGYAATANHYRPAQFDPSTLPPGKVLMSKEDAVYASCMRNVLSAIDVTDLQRLLVKSREEVIKSSETDDDFSGIETELDGIQQLIYSRRLLCNVLTDEISYLTMSNYGYMAESVRMDRTERQLLKDIQALLNTFDITLNE